MNRTMKYVRNLYTIIATILAALALLIVLSILVHSR
jgi:hypothetical protein